MNDEPNVPDPAVLASDLVRFFESLTPAARREYEELAARDREHGEDAAHDGEASPPERGGS